MDIKSARMLLFNHMFAFEEKDSRQIYIPWAIFDDLRDEKNYRYGNVATLPRMRSRVLEKYAGTHEVPEPTLAGLSREIERSRFGDVLAYLAKKKILSGAIPCPPFMLHALPKTYYIKLNAREELQSSHYTPLYGGGASYTSFAEALSKAIGELLERYVLLTNFFHKKNKIMRMKLGDERIPHALIHETPRFFEWQRKYVPHGLTSELLTMPATHTAVVHCVKGESLNMGKKIYMPLQHVQWGPRYTQGTFGADTYALSPKTTSGAGGGFTLIDATLSGLCELLERDGFLIYWLNRLSPRRICIDEQDSDRFMPRFLEVYRSLADRGYQVYFLDTTTDIRIPSIACLILAPLPHGRKSISVTGKCHPDPHRALELSLLEHALLLNPSIPKAGISVSDPAYVPFADATIGKKERTDLWRSGNMTDKINFFISGKEISSGEWAHDFPAPPTDQDNALSSVLHEFSRMEKQHGEAYEVFRYEARHHILEELEYHVVKIVVPALIPLYLREHAAFLDCGRLREVPCKLGYQAAPIDQYNPLPHPFP